MKIPSTSDNWRQDFSVNEQQRTEIENKARLIEQNYSHLFANSRLLNEPFE